MFLSKYPRKPVDDIPDWGILTDHKIPTRKDNYLECWVIYPESMKEIYDKNPQDLQLRQHKTVILSHGAGRNRGRMVNRARLFNELDYIVILHSVRDHGNSPGSWYGASIGEFQEDLLSVVNWWNHPVILYGHSLGAAASIIVSNKSPLVKALITDASPAEYPHNLRYAIKPAFRQLTPIFYLGASVGMILFYIRRPKVDYNPGISASKLKIPALVFHGKHDELYPPICAERLGELIDNSEVHVIDHADHSTVHEDPSFQIIIKEFLVKNKLN